jgi:two-component system, cell cycle sensor histidine kinase and response regulator CckA
VTDLPRTLPTHVLLVEDHASLRRILVKTLTSAGFQVTAAENGDQARYLLENGALPDVLLSDIRMPGALDGIQLARWVRTNRPTIAIVLQSAFSEYHTEEFKVVQKPFGADELIAALGELRTVHINDPTP